MCEFDSKLLWILLRGNNGSKYESLKVHTNALYDLDSTMFAKYK